jgi:hypothetical protein
MRVEKELLMAEIALHRQSRRDNAFRKSIDIYVGDLHLGLRLLSDGNDGLPPLD